MTTAISVRVVSLAVNLPGPLAASRLTQFGATVTKIEPPQGDPLARSYPELYRKLHRGQEVVALDLKSAAGQARIEALLADADLLLTALRPRALAKLGLDWDQLQRKFPRLCHVAIVGFPAPDQDRPGHDLTYQAAAGLLEPPQLPRVLIADSAGAERAVSAALALLLARATGGDAGRAVVALTDAVESFAAPLRYGATRDNGLLGGGSPVYGLYETRAGWIALAALENVFIEGLRKTLNLTELNRKSLQEIFMQRTAKEWEQWGRQNDIPLAAVINLEA